MPDGTGLSNPISDSNTPTPVPFDISGWPPLSITMAGQAPQHTTMFQESLNLEDQANCSYTPRLYIPNDIPPSTSYSGLKSDEDFLLSTSSTTPFAHDSQNTSMLGSNSNTDQHQQYSSRTSCSTCLLTFGRKTDLERHLKSIHFDNHASNACFISGCDNNKGKGYSRRDKLTEHQWRKHPELGYRKASRGRQD